MTMGQRVKLLYAPHKIYIALNNKVMCVNIHNLFGPFTWWPTIPKTSSYNEHRKMLKAHTHTHTETTHDLNKEKRRDVQCKQMDKRMNKTHENNISFTHDSNQRCRQYSYCDYCYYVQWSSVNATFQSFSIRIFCRSSLSHTMCVFVWESTFIWYWLLIC